MMMPMMTKALVTASNHTNLSQAIIDGYGLMGKREQNETALVGMVTWRKWSKLFGRGRRAESGLIMKIIMVNWELFYLE
jgi:hypothetical protein